MKHLRRIGLGILLALALSMPAFAGTMPVGGITGPQESPGITGDMPNGSTEGEIPTPPGLTGDILFPGVAAIISLLF